MRQVYYQRAGQGRSRGRAAGHGGRDRGGRRGGHGPADHRVEKHGNLDFQRIVRSGA
jgi:hypothetical protein